MNPFKKKTKQHSIFITAGYPKIDSLPKQIAQLEASGIDFIEVGIPFSDPMADGPTIQHSSTVALKNGMTIPKMFTQLESVTTKIPLVIMSYFNPILHFGLESFLKKCVDVNIRHLIIPDISLEVYDAYYRERFEQSEVSLCFLATPSTSSERIQKIVERSPDGFLYLVSSAMTTGSSAQRVAPEEVQRIREAIGSLPLMIGFGIKTQEDVAAVHAMADGAIIGSAYIQALELGSEATFIAEILAC